MFAKSLLHGGFVLLLVVGPVACGDGGAATSKAPATPPPAPVAVTKPPPAPAKAETAPAAGETPLVSRPPIRVPQGKLPPAKTHYMGRRIAYTMHFAAANWLTRSTREKEENASRMLQSLKIQPGQTVCDLGCGNGYHTLRMAEMVGPTGKVYAVDIQPEMLEMLRKRAEEARIGNIVRIHNSLVDPGLPPGSCDLILMVDVYHEFSHPEPMLAGIRKALKPDGLVVLVEFKAEDPEIPIKSDHKMSQVQVRKELEANGFVLAREFKELPWQHAMFFRRAELILRQTSERLPVPNP